MFKNKYISLVLLWCLGSFMLIYMCIPLLTPKKDSPVIESHLNTYNIDNNSEAYVLVTIDEKHFLTRFVSYLPEQTDVLARATRGMHANAGKNVERVLIRIKPVRGKKTEDFTIKPAPLE